MTFRRRVALPLAPLALLGLLFTGCAGRDLRTGTVPEPDSWSAIYKGRFTSPEGETSRFRSWVWAAAPDRLHIEVFGPMGGTRLSVDGGGGLLAVSLVQDKVAFVGEAAGLELSPVFGVPMTLEQTVSALTGGGRPPGLTVWRRDATTGDRLPLRLQVGTGGALLELTRLEVRTVPPGRSALLGTGTPPDGIEVRPLADLLEGGGEGLLQ